MYSSWRFQTASQTGSYFEELKPENGKLESVRNLGIPILITSWVALKFLRGALTVLTRTQGMMIGLNKVGIPLVRYVLAQPGCRLTTALFGPQLARSVLLTVATARDRHLGVCRPRLRAEGRLFRDPDNREVIVRGINVAGDAKYPRAVGWPFHGFGGDNVSFVGRPFSLKEADVHLNRLQKWGYNGHCLPRDSTISSSRPHKLLSHSIHGTVMQTFLECYALLIIGG